MAVPEQMTSPVAASTVSPPKLSTTDQGKTSLRTVVLLIDIPVIKAIIDKSVSVWGKVKDESLATKWTLNAVEFTVRSAAKAGRILAWPFSIPINITDCVISGHIIEAERRWPILKESPNKVVEVAVESARGRARRWYATAGAVAADGKRALQAAADVTRNMASAVPQALADFEDLVDEMAARAAGESRIVEGQSCGTSEASGPPPAAPRVGSLARRALESVVHLYVGAAVRALCAGPLLGRLAEALLQPRTTEADGSRASSPSHAAESELVI